jgi:hypothetical protein
MGTVSMVMEKMHHGASQQKQKRQERPDVFPVLREQEKGRNGEEDAQSDTGPHSHAAVSVRALLCADGRRYVHGFNPLTVTRTLLCRFSHSGMYDKICLRDTFVEEMRLANPKASRPTAWPLW